MVTVPTAVILGWPVRHSRSPMIHRHWLATLGIAGDYVPLPVEPERIDVVLAGFAALGYVGGNVTVPHKEAAFRAVEAADDVAAALGAVNTLWLDGDRLVGGNTDAAGFLANLDETAPGWDATDFAVVLGAGGAARAVLWALRSRGIGRIVVVNRTLDRAEALAKHFGKPVEAAEWATLPRRLKKAGLLVNTTTLGMTGHPEMTIDLAPLPDGAVVNDLVYVPLETGLLAAARKRRLVAVDGLGMLLHQAVPGFERWFGR
ncbi:MAG: shikimate dehydrogenase, partial [Bauldia sp.]